MFTREPARAVTVLGRLKLRLRQWKRGSMPDCGCTVRPAKGTPAVPMACTTTKSAAKPSRQPELVEPDPERLARVAMYALGGYFHSGCLGDMFICTPDIWIERVKEHG